MKFYQNRYFLAALVGLILGAFGAAQQAVQILAKTNPELASILGAGLIGLALFVNVLPRPNDIVHPQVNVEQAREVTVNPPSPDAPQWESDTRPLASSPAATEPPAVNVTARLPRAKSGRFERTGATVVQETPPPP